MTSPSIPNLWRTITLVCSEKSNTDSLEYKYTESIPECSNNKCLFPYFAPFDSISTPFERQSDVKLNAGTSCHLCHPVPAIDNIESLLYVDFRKETSMQRCERDGCGKLTVSEYIWLHAKRQMSQTLLKDAQKRDQPAYRRIG